MSTVTWIASEAGVASDGANWSGGIAPQTGDDVIFDATSVNNCLWDLDASIVTVNSITLATGYTGTLTQGDVDIGIGAGGYLQQDGTITGAIGHAVYISGSMTVTGGSVTENRISLVFTGDGSLSTYNRFRYRNFEVTGNLTLLSNQYMTYQVSNSIFNVSGTLNMGNYDFLMYFINGIRCDGAINGGTLSLSARESVNTFAMGSGVISSKIRIYTPASASSSSEILVLPASIIGSLTVESEHDTYMCTLNLNGHSLIATSVTVGTRGAIVGDGTIINHGDLDSSLGSIDLANIKYIQAGAGTIKLAEGQKFKELLCIAPTKLASDIIVDDVLAYVHPIDKGAFNITNDRTKEYTGLRRPFIMPLKRRRLSNPSHHSLMEFIWYD